MGNSTKLTRPRRLARWSYPVALALGTYSLAAATGSGSVTGAVVDDGGRPVAGARVLISHAPPATASQFTAPPVITGRLATMVISDARGSFSADRVAPGQYIACAETSQQGLLDPCHWAASAPTFNVSDGQTTSAVKIMMVRGAVVRIHIDDPQHLLKPASGPVDLDFQVHVRTGKGLHYSAPIQSSTAVAREHAITVPFDTPVTLRVLSGHFAVNDQSGGPVPPLGTALTVPAGTASPVLGLTVTGKK